MDPVGIEHWQACNQYINEKCHCTPVGNSYQKIEFASSAVAFTSTAYRSDRPLHFIRDVPWIDPSHLAAQKRFKAFPLVEGANVIPDQPFLSGLAAICVELLADIATAKGRKASPADEP
jgi:hypothetical protein